MSVEIVKHDDGLSFNGKGAVKVYQAIAIKTGLAMYQRSKMLPNRMWTPAAMLRTAGSITGKQYKRGQYQRAITDLTTWIEANRVPVRVA